MMGLRKTVNFSKSLLELLPIMICNKRLHLLRISGLQKVSRHQQSSGWRRKKLFRIRVTLSFSGACVVVTKDIAARGLLNYLVLYE